MSAHDLTQKHKLLECIQCGMCTGVCPVSKKTNLNVRNYMREAAVYGELPRHPENELWSCTTCATCEARCPKEIKPYEFLIDIRGSDVEAGKIATTLRDALESVFKNGNPWGRTRSKRTEWTQDLAVKHYAKDMDFLYFVGCTPAYDPRAQEVAKSFVTCLEKAGISFGILGTEENCCGNEVYGMGEKGLFEHLAEANQKLFRKYDLKQLVTSCPHSYHTFKNRYETRNFEVNHHTQLLANLIDEERLAFQKKLGKKIIYHDPCFLGKQNNVYDEPRKIIESLPDVELLEFDRSRERSLCCEGGGGRMWIDIPGPRLAEARVQEAIDYGAQILAVACPFCLSTFEDAVKTAGVEDQIQIKDVAELLSQTL